MDILYEYGFDYVSWFKDDIIWCMHWTGLCEIDIIGIHSCNLIEQEFNYGVECVLLISFSDNASRHAVKEAFDALQSLIVKYNSFIVQATQGIYEWEVTQFN